jgi:hypothetical protein
MHPVAAGELERWTVDQQAGADRRSPARKHGQSPQGGTLQPVRHPQHRRKQLC